MRLGFDFWKNTSNSREIHKNVSEYHDEVRMIHFGNFLIHKEKNRMEMGISICLGIWNINRP